MGAERVRRDNPTVSIGDAGVGGIANHRLGVLSLSGLLTRPGTSAEHLLHGPRILLRPSDTTALLAAGRSFGARSRCFRPSSGAIIFMSTVVVHSIGLKIYKLFIHINYI